MTDPRAESGPWRGNEPVRDVLRPEGVEPRPMGWWGTLLTCAVLGTAYAAMYFAYVYIRIGVTDWPPAGFEPPALGLPALATAALAASALPLALLRRRGAQGARPKGLRRAGVTAALVLGVAHLVLLMAEWARTDFAVSDHAYASLFYVLPAIHASAFAIAILLGVGLLLHSLAGHTPSELSVGERALGLYWTFCVLGGVGLLAVVYLLPHLWPVATGTPPEPPSF